MRARVNGNRRWVLMIFSPWVGARTKAPVMPKWRRGDLSELGVFCNRARTMAPLGRLAVLARPGRDDDRANKRAGAMLFCRPDPAAGAGAPSSTRERARLRAEMAQSSVTI